MKNPPCNAGDTGLLPGWGTKIPHVTGHGQKLKKKKKKLRSRGETEAGLRSHRKGSLGASQGQEREGGGRGKRGRACVQMQQHSFNCCQLLILYVKLLIRM